MPPVDYHVDFAGWKSQRGMLVDHIRTLAPSRRRSRRWSSQATGSIDVGHRLGRSRHDRGARRGGRVDRARGDRHGRLGRADRPKQRAFDAVRIVRGDAGGLRGAGAGRTSSWASSSACSFLEEWRHYAAFAQVRDRNLRAGGTVDPACRAPVSCRPIDSRKLYRERGYGFWEDPVYGLDFSDVLEAEIAAPRRYIISADHNATVCTREIAAFDFLTGTERDYFFTTDVEFPYAAAGSFHGFIGHFELDMAAGQVLSTAHGREGNLLAPFLFPRARYPGSRRGPSGGAGAALPQNPRETSCASASPLPDRTRRWTGRSHALTCLRSRVSHVRPRLRLSQRCLCRLTGSIGPCRTARGHRRVCD